MPDPKMLQENSVYKEWEAMVGELQSVSENSRDENLKRLSEETAELFETIQSHYMERNDMGSCLPMSLEEYDKVQNQYKKCLNTFDQVSGELSNNPVCQKLRTMLLNDSIALNGLSDHALPPLADVLTGSFIPEAELYETDEKDNTIGDALSSREAIEYTDQNGTVHRGFFTEDKSVNRQRDDLHVVFDRYVKKYPQYQDFFEELEAQPKEFLNRVGELTHRRNETDYNDFIYHIAEETDTKLTDARKFEAMCYELAKEIEPIRNYHSILSSSRIDEGTKIAGRAGAMTDMAAALGEKDLLAPSRRITVKRGDQVVSGVLMEAAFLDGVDRKKLTNENLFYKVEKKEFDNPDLLRSLADLQILDYLCANTDRHKNNFFMRLDSTDPKHPKITGVQGIDNDNSFGRLKIGGVMRLAKESNIKVITSKMAEKIKAMTQEDLERVMEPYLLKPSERQAASERLLKLQVLIDNGTHPAQDKLSFDASGRLITKETEIRIIKDDEWKQLSMDSLIPEKPTEENIFTQAQIIRDDQVQKKDSIESKQRYDQYMKEKNPERWAREQKEKVVSSEDEKKKAPFRFAKSDDRALIDSILKQLTDEHQQLKNIDQDLYNAEANDKGRSRKFKDMYQKMDAVSQEYQKLSQELRNVQSIGNQEKKVLSESFHRLAQKREALLEAASVYRKKGSLLSGPKLKQRKQSAKELEEFAGKQQKSERLFRRGMAIKDRQAQALSKKSGEEFSAYQTRQLQDMMKKALHDNVASLAVDDPRRALGIKALAAWDRLWQFSQKTTAKPASALGQKQKLDFNQMKAESQVEKDAKAILAYAPNVKKMIDQVNEKMKGKDGKDHSIKLESLTPRQARTVLGMLFEHESKFKQSQPNKVEVAPEKKTKVELKKTESRMNRINSAPKQEKELPKAVGRAK